ncbi:type II toxin-antitoxin system mRNA interferase toxin, RelE/StbE family [Candidatus Daviesbacteria bacterium]|nr:type II toxin-antitoxin system mRNA interferase toxin, RelE/StbE family [Candidatus Daviesbacteria bacterium]
MNAVYDSAFVKKLKKVGVRIRKSFKERILIFSKNPYDLQLNNHALKDGYKGYRSIDIAGDWRAIYKETQIGKEVVAYFVEFGTHVQLYKKQNK